VLFHQQHAKSGIGCLAHGPRQAVDHQGSQAEGKLVGQQKPRLGPRARASVSICCSPPDSRPAFTRHSLRSSGNSATAALMSSRPILRFSSVVRPMNTDLLSHETEAAPGAPVQRGPGRLPVEHDPAAGRGDLAREGQQGGGLARPVGAKQATTSPGRTSRSIPWTTATGP
jgi:hypothetical protein